jgi:hypothetical protein
VWQSYWCPRTEVCAVCIGFEQTAPTMLTAIKLARVHEAHGAAHRYAFGERGRLRTRTEVARSGRRSPLEQTGGHWQPIFRYCSNSGAKADIAGGLRRAKCGQL